MDEVGKQLTSLNVNKAVGEDQIPARLLKDATPVIVESVAYLVNKSIESGIFPESWKLARELYLYVKLMKVWI